MHPNDSAAPAAHNGEEDDVSSPRAKREELCRAVLDGTLSASEFPSRFVGAMDRWLTERLEGATKGKTRGYALLAVGGFGRRELAPGSDLDLVLLHRARRGYAVVAEGLWYAVWDAGARLDHSVRTRAEALAIARSDLKAILGLLDGRVVAGDRALGERLLAEIPPLWRKLAPGLLPELEDSMLRRHRSAGELAFLLEPDLKLSEGGLRDAAALRALVVASPGLGSVTDVQAVASAERLIISARVVLHARTGSANDRLLLQEQDQVAEILNYVDADALMAALAEAARTIASATQEAWRRIRLARSNAGSADLHELAVADGIVRRGGEIALTSDADPASDPSLMIRVTRAAAERNALLERETLDRLEAASRAPAAPWPAATREAFIGLLSTGDALVPVVEALDQRHLFELLIPEWSAVRNRPQRNAYHRYTVDRHLLETVARAGEHLDDVQRADLLVMGALLHDIGKGYAGDHSEVGKELAAAIARRMGFPDEDVVTVVQLVAYHLVLPECATRRDLDDPSTAKIVAKIVENRQTLELLTALTEADSRATGSAAWGPWKAELVATLVDRVGRVLDGEQLSDTRSVSLTPDQLELVEGGRLAVHALGRTVTVVAPDRPGLLAAVTGALALHGCNVRRATAQLGAREMAVEIFDIEPAFDRLPTWDRVERDIAAALDGRIDLDARLAEHDQTYARGRRPASAYPTEAHVLIDNESSAAASIIEVRAVDRLGLLHTITAAFAHLNLDVVSALVDTLGHEVIDTFYVRDRAGTSLTSRARSEEVRVYLEEVIARVA